MVALDNGLENPQFACLEIDYGDQDTYDAAVVTGDHQKVVVIYEVDLGLNHVIRKNSENVPKSTHALVPVPGSSGDEIEGPGGLIVVCENFVIYKKLGHDDRRCSIPVRYDQSLESGLFITNSQAFFNSDLGVIIFIQSEHGDIYKVSLD
jgi:splicing factor 3B subunit 3